MQIRDEKFENIWLLTTEKFGEPECKRRQNLSAKEKYNKLFYEIFDKILIQMKQRFNSIEELFFVELLDCKKFKNYDVSFPIKAFETLKKSYHSFFDFPRLRSELSVLYSHEYFANKNISELLKHLVDNNMDKCLQEIYKLANLILTIPITTSSVERSFSALKRIKTYLRSSQKEQRLSNLSLISIEKTFLKQMMENRELFYNSVIDKFCQKTRRIDFIFK